MKMIHLISMTKPKGDFIASESQFVSNKKLVETQGLP